MRHRRLTLSRLLPIAALLLLVAVGDARAGASCSVSVTPVTFGTYNVFTPTALDSTGTIVYQCSPSARNIWITVSRGVGGTFTARQMLSLTSDRLEYNLFRDAARTTIWGDFSGGTSGHYDRDPPNNAPVEVPIYARIPAGQDVQAGLYGDYVTVTINY